MNGGDPLYLCYWMRRSGLADLLPSLRAVAPGLGMKAHWTALSYYPHSLAVGIPDLHAERLAMKARRNSCEALFSALQLGNKLGLDGAARTRTAKEPTVEALVSIALMQRSAFMLADLRIQRGLFRDDVPPDLARALAL